MAATKSPYEGKEDRMKKFALVKFLLLAIFIIAIVVFIVNSTGEKFNENNAGKTAKIQYEYVNLRSDPKVSVPEDKNVLDVIYEGQRVTLTGREYEYLGGSEYTVQDRWIEVEFEGQIGWVVAPAINWFSLH